MIDRAALPYVLPFAVFIGLLGIRAFVPLGAAEYPLWLVVLAAAVWFSRGVIEWRLQSPLGSVTMGVAVFAVWIAPELLFPGYRSHWLFENSLLGNAQSSFPAEYRGVAWITALRFVRAAVMVPILEELFWRGWLMRWLVKPDFRSVPLGAYSASAFWITALLFASEHGARWDVGLAAGVAYNWWMMRTRSLGDCILAHAVTNACLSAFVIVTGQWQYW